MEFFRISFAFWLIIQAISVPVKRSTGDSTLNFVTGKDYTYTYETDTVLFINDISDEAKSTLKLKTSVIISPLGGDSFGFRLSDTSLTGESVDSSALDQLSLGAEFQLSSQGDLASDIKFDAADEQWSKNIKRAIISTFQVKSYDQLRSADGTDAKSGVFYERDVLGRCRTTYRVEQNDYQSAGSFSMEKSKALQRCTLDRTGKSSGGQFVPYKQIPEFFDGRLFIEDYSCKSVVKDNVVNSVSCKEVSTFKFGSRGVYGAQAIVNTHLQFRSVSSSSYSAGSFVEQDIAFEYFDAKIPNIETSNFNPDQFTSDICDNALKTGLANDHATQFKDLVLTMKTMDFSVNDMIQFYESSAAKCTLAGYTATQALVFVNTDESVEACLTLIDQGAFDSQKYITEYPVLTGLARNPNPSNKLIDALKSYLSSKSADFAYLNKVSLVYSTLVYTHCKHAGCSQSQLAEYASVFVDNLGSDCSDSADQNVVVAALKSVGNIGNFPNPKVLVNCALNKANPIETRVVAIQSARRFTCENIEKTNVFYHLLEDGSDDSEVRITAFTTLMRCSDESEKFAKFASERLSEFLLNEEDQQVLSFVIDYGKEHGLTTILNAALDDPRIREKFEVDFKRLSWNNYKYRYNFLRDAAFEVETSVIYTPKTWVPRSIYFNMTSHAFGASVGLIEANVRLEGMDEVLKAVIIDKLTSEQVLKRILAEPEQLMDVLQNLASKLNYVKESPKLSVSFRIYGNDVFYSNIDNAAGFQKLANFIKSPRQTLLYRQVETIKNLFFIDTTIRQPLMNGFSFNKYMDISTSALLSKKSSKSDDDEFTFNIDNFWSASGSFTGTYEVAVNKAKKLSLKKKSFMNARLKLNVQGFKNNGHWQYKMNLSPMTQIPLFTADGIFLKLGNGGVFTQVTEFKTKQINYEKCNTDKFKNTFDNLQLCFTVSRPDLGSLVKILRDRRQGDLEEQFNAYYSDLQNDLVDGEENFENDNTKRPTLPLAGPYHYELVVNNPDLVKALVLDAKFSRSLDQSDVTATISSVSQQDEEQKRVELVYSRIRKSTLRGVHGKVNIALTEVATGDVRLKFLGEVLYHKKQVLNVHLEVENKIVRPFHHMISFGRDARDKNSIVPKYHLEVLMDTSRGPRRYNIHFDVTPGDKRDLTSNFHVERSSPSTGNVNVRYMNGQLTFTPNSPAGFDYNLEFHGYNLIRQANLDITGRVAFFSFFKSDIDLTIDYKNPFIIFPKPARISLGHSLDMSEGGKSTMGIHVEHAYRNIDHSVKVTFAGNIAAKTLNLLQIDLNKPGLSQPVTLFFEKSETTEGLTYNKEVQIGVRNLERDLTKSKASFAGTLIKVDFDNTLRSLVLHVKKTHVKGASINRDFYLKKNGNAFVTIKQEIFGDMDKVRSSFDELAKTAFGYSFYMKVMENSGAVSARLDLESSKTKQNHMAEFNFKTENLFKILSRVASFNAKVLSTKSDFDASFEMKRLGEVKSFKVFSTSGLRRIGNSAEFNVGYEKKLANGKVFSAPGQAKFTFTNFKNFESDVNVPNHYNHKLSVVNSRDATQNGLFANHNFNFINSHLDYEPLQNRFQLQIENMTDANGFRNLNFNIDARKSDLNQLDNRDAVAALGAFSTKNIIAPFGLVTTYNSIDLKSNRFNLDLNKQLNYYVDISTGQIQLDTKTNLKIPAIITDPGKLNYVTHEMVITKSNDIKSSVTLKNRFETDSKLFGRVFRVLNIDFERSYDAQANVNDADLVMNYKLAKNPDQVELTNWKFVLKHDLFTPTKSFMDSVRKGYKFEMDVKQNRFPVYRSFLTGAMVDVSECRLVETKEREKTNSLFNLEYTLNVNCKGKLLTHSVIAIDSVYDATNLPSTRVGFTSKSEVFYPPIDLRFAHDKFSANHGLVGVAFNVLNKSPFSHEFSYDRSMNAGTNQLRSAHYQVSTAFGEQISKVCTFDVLNSVDYYNSFNCRLNTTKVPNMELNYGYNLKLSNVAERAYGKRGGEFNLVIPGRTMKAVYSANYPAYFDGNDDDDDINNEREFNATSTLYWNYVKEPTKFITVNAKRDNFAKGKSTTYVEFVDTPHFKQLKFAVDKTRSFNETNLVASMNYEMKSGASNRLTVDAKLSSDMDTSRLSVETNLQHPSFNTRYENRFNKLNGRLQYLGIRVGKVLQLSIDKENTDEERRISIQLANPDESKYNFDGSSNLNGDLYTVQGTLSRDGTTVSSIISRFNAANTDFNVVVTGKTTNDKYNFNFGVFNETLASAVTTKNGKILGKTTLQIANTDGLNELVMSIKFNRFWRDVQEDILGTTDNQLAKPSPDYNSYFGDVYASVTEDLKPIVQAHRLERAAIQRDFRNLMGVLLDFYSNFLGEEGKREFMRNQMKQMAEAVESQMKSGPELPIYKKVLRSYNRVAKKLTALSVGLRKYSKSLSKFVPRFPTYEYNEVTNEFANNLVIRRPSLYAKTLYQFNHEYRDYVRKASQNFLALKRNLVRSNLGGLGIRSLINKYKYRSLNDYTLVATVFNKRNIIGFDGEHAILQSRCKYLLTHEVQKNRFSVVLNFEKDADYPITVSAFGQSVDIGYSGASVDGASSSLPRQFDLGNNNGVLAVRKTVDGVCAELNHDLSVCCYDDSKSCTVAATRWFTGKLDGLLGRADSNIKNIKQEDWYLDNKCKYRNQKSRLPSIEAVQTCYQMFGRHRRAVFKNAINTVKPDGWKAICESVLTASLRYKCAIMNAFVHHARVEEVKAAADDECFACTINNKNYRIGQKIAPSSASLSTNIASGIDLVFILFPCKSEQFPQDVMDNLKEIVEQFASTPENRYHFVRVEGDEASIYQSASGEISNVESMHEAFFFSSTGSVSKTGFDKAMILAGSIFTQRIPLHRSLVFSSCGNCPPYRLNSSKYVSRLRSRNVIVSSIGDYKMQNLEDPYSNEKPYAYDAKKVYLHDHENDESDYDFLDSVQIDHNMDMCSRLAVKTDGFVANRDLNSLVDVGKFLWTPNLPEYSYKVNQCQRLSTPYGELTDFSYSRSVISENDYDY